MKTQKLTSSKPTSTYTLGQLVAIVDSCTKNNRETLAAVADLFARGTISIIDNGESRKVRLA